MIMLSASPATIAEKVEFRWRIHGGRSRHEVNGAISSYANASITAW